MKILHNNSSQNSSLMWIFLEKFRFLLKKGFFHIFSSELLSKIIRFGSSLIIVNVLTRDSYGSYSYANNILQFFLLLSGLGVQAAVLQFCSEKKERKEKLPFLKYGVKIGLYTNFFIAAAIILFTIFFDLPVKGSKEILFYLALIPLFSIGYEIIGGYLRADFRNKEFSYVNIFFAILFFFGVLFGGYFFKIKGIILAQYVAFFCSVLIGLKFLLKEVKGFRAIAPPPLKEKKEFIKFAFIAVSTNSVSQILYLLDIFLIGIIIKAEIIVASYKVATIIPFALNFIPLSIIMFAYPYFAQNISDTRKIKTYFIELQKYLLILNFGISVFLIGFAPIIIKILFKGQYSDAVLPFRILSFGYFIAASFRIPAGNVIASIRKVKINFIIALFSGGLNICLNIVLIQKLGSRGAAIATVCVIIFSSVFSNLYLRHYFKKRLS